MSISAKERREIPDNKMGDPAHDKFPLDTEEHIRSAANLIGHAKDKKQVAENILRRAKEEGVSTDGMHKVKQVAGVAEQVPPMSDGTSLGNAPPRTMAPYYDEAGEQLAQRIASTSSQMSAGVSPTTEEDELMSRMNQIGVAHAEAIGKRDMKAEPFQFAQKIVKEISAQVEKDSKPPTGNQNCQLCTWCAEARYRGINALPRPIYSPRDPALAIKGETVVMNPIKESFKSQKEVVRKVRGNVDSRWYVHVNWKDSTGGHEFLVININDYAYIMDAQVGLVKEIDELDSAHNYFRDINFKNSYMVRLDTRPFNTSLFNDVNNPANVMPWKNSLDIPYMRDNGMLAPGDDSDPRFRRVFVPSDEGLKYLKEDPELSQYWEDMHKGTNGEFLVNRETGEAIGHAFVHTTKKNKGFIFNIEVTPKYRRQGYGWILIDDAVRRFGGEDLTVRCDNEPAVHLYLDYGFEIYKKGVWYDPPHEEYWMKYDRSKLTQESTNVFESGHFAKYKDDVLGFNDEGMAVMKRCDCGGKISIAMKGEPIYTCELCGKTYGCVPFQESFADYQEAFDALFILEAEAANQGILAKIIDWCKRAIQFIIGKIKGLFGVKDSVKTNVDINALNQQAHSTMAQIENDQPVDINKLNQQLAACKNPSEIKNVQEAIKQINANIELINKALNKDGLDQQTATALQKLLTAYMTALKDIQNNQQASQGNKTIIEALKKSILTNNANGSSNIQVYPYLYSRTYYIDFDTIGLVFPTELIKNPLDASKYVLKCVESFGHPARPQFNSSVTYYNGFYTVLIQCLAAQLAEKVGYKPETFTTERGETRKKFLNDVVGRSMQICIGYIVSAEEIKKNGIPAVSYQMLWNIYLKAQEHSFFVPEGNIADENKKRRIPSSLVTVKSNPMSDIKPVQEGVVGKVIVGGIAIVALINLAIAVKDAIKEKRYEKNTPTDGKLLSSIEKFLTYYNALEYKNFLTDTSIRYEYIHDTMGDFDSHLKTIIKYITECINTTSNCYKSNEKMFKEFFTECKTTRVALWDIVCKLDDHVKDYDVDEHCVDKTAMNYRKHYKTLLDQLMKQIEKFLKTLQKTIDSKNVVQEGAFQDLKNGVNPYSDDLVFHVSMDKHIDGQVWKPRVPDYLDPYNPEDTGFEDNTTPRICFSTSIEGALNGITVNLQRQSADTFDKMYVYVPEKPWKEYKHKTNKQLVKGKLVYDANVTREVWIMEPVRMKLYGVIRVDQIADAKRKSVVPTSKGQKDTRNYFTYKWHWVVKPKVLKKATKFDYSPERVIDDLCVDIKKFKYGLIRDGRLMTGNVSDADYEKYWVFHSGETVDQAGGGNCYDMVEYEAGYLEAFGVAYKKYFMNFTNTKNTKTLNTHTICVVPLDGKFVYIEQAFKRVVDEWGYERKKEFDKLTDIFEYVAEVSAEYHNQDLNYGVWDYTDAEIDYGTPIKNFQEWIFNNCTMIHDGEASISKPVKESFVIPTRFSEYHYKEGHYV